MAETGELMQVKVIIIPHQDPNLISDCDLKATHFIRFGTNLDSFEILDNNTIFF